MKQREIFLPLLKRYCEDNMDAIQSSNYPWCPFIPVAFNDYDTCSPKIFYIGIDTYYWGVTNLELIKAYRTDTLDTILNKNNEVVTPERILCEWKENKGQFWSFVCKLHLYNRTGKLFSNYDLRNLNQKECSYISEIGWGNMNSIELKRTLEKEDYWRSINKGDYWKLKASSGILIDPIKNIIDAYSPDYIYILGWGDSTDHIFRGLQFTELNEHYKENYRALYQIKDCATKVVWTSHPRRFGFLYTNQEKMIPYLVNSLNLFQ